MQYALTNIFSQADSLEAAAPQLLQKVCEQMGWDASVFWLANEKTSSLTL